MAEAPPPSMRQLTHPAKASNLVVSALARAAASMRIPHQCALVASTDSYYAGQGRAFPNCDAAPDLILEKYRARGVAALDMEAETILVVGERLGLLAGVLLAVHGNRSTDQWLEDFSAAQEQMIRVGMRGARPAQPGRDPSEIGALQR